MTKISRVTFAALNLLFCISLSHGQIPETLTPKEASDLVKKETEVSFQKVASAFDQIIEAVAKTATDADVVTQVKAQKSAFLAGGYFNEDSPSIYGKTDISPLYLALRWHRKQCHLVAEKYKPSIQRYLTNLIKEKGSTFAESEVKAFEKFKSDYRRRLYFSIAAGQQYSGKDFGNSQLWKTERLYGQMYVTVDKVEDRKVDLTVRLETGNVGNPPYISQLHCTIRNADSLEIDSYGGSMIQYPPTINYYEDYFYLEPHANFSTSAGKFLGINNYKAALFKVQLDGPASP